MKNKGFTLSEIMVAVFMTSVGFLALSTIVFFTFQQFHYLRDRLEAEASAARAESMFKTYLGQAVDVSMSNLPNNNWNISTTNPIGRLRANFVWDRIAASPNNWNTLAVFVREGGGNGPTQNYGGTPMKTAMWYRRPSPTTSGVIFLNVGEQGGAMSPSYGGLYADRITYLAMEKVGTGNRVTNVRVQIRVRYHRFSRFGTTWCPTQDIVNGTANCNNQVSYFDIERSFNVVLRNNLIKAAGTAGPNGSLREERTLGHVYFFRTVNPIVWDKRL